MILGTAYHSSLFAEAMLLEPGFAEWMSYHLLHMAHSHVVLVKNRAELLRGIKPMIPALYKDERIRTAIEAKLVNAFDKEGRLFDLTPNFTNEQASRLIDVVVIPSDEFRDEAMRAFGVDNNRICTWHDYREMLPGRGGGAPPMFLELRAMGSLSIKGWSIDSVVQSIFCPVLKWARGVTIIDKYVIKAFADLLYAHNPIAARKTWESFCDTICMIFRVWEENCAWPREETQPFRILTRNEVHYDGKTKRMDDDPEFCQLFLSKLVEHLRAGGIASVGAERIKVTFGSNNVLADEDAEHDRYLDVGFMRLAISRGFDLNRGSPRHAAQCAVAISRTEPKPLD